MDGAKGKGLYLLASNIKHSCEPNLAVKLLDGNSKISFVARRPISAGEELTCAYLSVCDLPLSQRQAKLQRRFHFVCTCEKCETEKATEP